MGLSGKMVWNAWELQEAALTKSFKRNCAMAYEFRLLETGFHRAAFNMGLDEALLRSVAEGKSLPTLRFYGWAPPAVSIGYFQGLHEEVDAAACKTAGIDVVRRITGGGAVFHHHEVTYSIVLPLSHPLARPNILDSYRLLLGGIIEGSQFWASRLNSRL